jgi:hypothetical protein
VFADGVVAEGHKLVEELWGRLFERRGSIKLEQMPGVTIENIRRLSTHDILELIRSEGDRSVRGLLAQMEKKRREDWAGRAALVVSILALIVAAFRP